MKFLVTALCLLFGAFHAASGHGQMMEPPSRSSLWRFPDDPSISKYWYLVNKNYNDDELFCGGFMHQQNLGGKCGVCGDAWDEEDPKPNEALGTYGKGIIVRQYAPGSWIDIIIEITAHHKGYFEMRLCPWNDQSTPVNHECLDQYVLQNPTTNSPKWFLPASSGGSSQFYEFTVKLPDGLECDQCVLQWKYHTGNNWDCDNSGHCCTGCGPQEEFYGCADIAIGIGPTIAPPRAGEPHETTTKSTTTSKATTTTTTNTQSTTTSSGGGTGPCPGAGAGSHLNDCTSFYQCNGNQMVVYDCPPATVFNENAGICDFPSNVPPPCGTA